jgi:hypothetical protein
MKQNQALIALAALLGVGAVVGFAQASPGGLSPKSPAEPPKIPKKPVPSPENIPGDVSGNPGAVVTPPPPDKMQAAAGALGFAKAQFQSETASAQQWTIALGPFAAGVAAKDLIDATKLGNIYDPKSGTFNPASETQPVQALLHEGLSAAVVRYKPSGPTWTDLPLAGTWYLVAEEGQA